LNKAESILQQNIIEEELLPGAGSPMTFGNSLMPLLYASDNIVTIFFVEGFFLLILTFPSDPSSFLHEKLD